MKILSLALAASLLTAIPVSAQTTQTIPWRPADVMALAEKAGDYQLTHIGDIPVTQWGSESVKPQSWEQGALFTGLTALADHSQKPEFAAAVLKRGQDMQWQPGARAYHADDYVIASSYLWDSRHGAGDAALAPTRARLDAILAAKPTNDLNFDTKPDCQARWCWADALFMAPPVWFEMSRLTGDAKYADYAKSEFWATADYLYDSDHHLFYRDSRFFERSDINGEKLFWSRGNGWVFAGLARIIPLLPANDPDRPKFIALFQQMAAELKSIQKPDGFWSPSLLGDPETSLPEESGTGFYTYGFAWGIKAGVLERTDYEPVVRSGWVALVRSVHPDGKVGYVQPVSDRPDNVGYEDTQFYGTGAFLLAATAVADLDLAPVEPLKPTVTIENTSDYDQPAVAASVRAQELEAAGAALEQVWPAGGWSIVVDGRTYPAETNGYELFDNLEFAVPLKAHQRVTVQIVPQASVLPRQVQAILNVQEGGTLEGIAGQGGIVKGGTFHLRSHYGVPADHFIHDGVIAFEGIGWESSAVAYRLYLDQRNVIDIYGKKLPGPILQSIGQNVGDYHSMNDWGQDIFQVDQSLGMGGLGKVVDGKAVQIGPSTIVAEVVNSAASAAAIVESLGFDDGKASLRTVYQILAGSPLTWVNAQATGQAPAMAAGLVHHKDMTVLTSSANAGDWHYVATWGRQSLAGDDLGIALFYRASETSGPSDDGQTLFVTFKNPGNIAYVFGATWAQDLSGVKTQADFQHWLNVTVDYLEHQPIISINR